MPENISPEEKLFRIIQEGKDNPPEKKEPKKKEQKPFMDGIKQFFAGIKFKPQAEETSPAAGEAARAIPLPFALNDAELKKINRMLAILLGVVMLFAFYYLMARRPSMREFSESASGLQFEMAKRKPIEAFKPLSFYMERVEKRNIFQPAPKVKKEVVVIKEPPRKKLAELASDFTLQGISWGEVPKAMIMTGVDEQIFFLKEGQKIGITGITVKSIMRDKVMISYGEEEMELL